MKNRFVVVVAICICAALVFLSTAQMFARTENPSANLTQYRGTIKVLDKDARTFMLQVRTAVIQCKYTDQTKFTYRNEPGSIDEVREGRRVFVLLDPTQKKDMVALRIDLRTR